MKGGGSKQEVIPDNSRQSTASEQQRTSVHFGSSLHGGFLFSRREVPVNTEAPIDKRRAERTEEKRSTEGSEVAGFYFTHRPDREV